MNGEQHDAAIANSLPLVGIGSAAIAFSFNIPEAFFIAPSYLLGGFYLSPDLDTESRPTNRWKRMGLDIWFWYRYAIPHRSSLSHGMFIGSAIRLGFLAIPVGLLLHYIQLTPFITKETLLFIYIGVEASAWMHLYCDGILFKKRNSKNSRRNN